MCKSKYTRASHIILHNYISLYSKNADKNPRWIERWQRSSSGGRGGTDVGVVSRVGFSVYNKSSHMQFILLYLSIFHMCI